MSRFLTIMEVSQKQAYIFASNALKDNIANSETIEWVMSSDYFEKVIKDEKIYNKADNYVYSGGGHVVLEFPESSRAIAFAKRITSVIRKEYPGIEVFAKTLEYDESIDAGKNIKLLTAALEKKKSLRAAAFHQGSFGVEVIDRNTLKPVLAEEAEEKHKMELNTIDYLVEECGYRNAVSFHDLGGSKNDSNFIAVVHIDGNAMGKRVEELYEENKSLDWNAYKVKLDEFSTKIDCDFKSAYGSMVKKVAENLTEKGLDEKLSLKNNYFPVRRIITAGDDICFVSEGRIGIECAVEFIRALNQLGYHACAGISIVHQKYPFYRAYELAELLCSNAKKFGADFSKDGTGFDISCVDWHIEFGEIRDSLEEIRSRYITLDAKEQNRFLHMRPYIVHASDDILVKEKNRQYRHFSTVINKILQNEKAYSNGRLKELRGVLKKGEVETKHYLKFHKISSIAADFTGNVNDSDEVFVTTSDGISRSILFDAIELMDTYIGLE